MAQAPQQHQSQTAHAPAAAKANDKPADKAADKDKKDKAEDEGPNKGLRKLDNLEEAKQLALAGHRIRKGDMKEGDFVSLVHLTGTLPGPARPIGVVRPLTEEMEKEIFSGDLYLLG